MGNLKMVTRLLVTQCLWTVLTEVALAKQTHFQTEDCTEINGLNVSVLTKENFSHKRTWSKITCIILQDDVIQSIELGLFSNFKKMKKLTMKNIGMLGRGVVDGFEGINSTALVRLHLDNIGLTRATTDEILTKLSGRIKKLTLQYNHIESFSFHSIRHLKKIGSINLSGNKNLAFSIGTLQNFTQLKSLDLSFTNFYMNSTFCPKGWSHFPRLRSLSLEGNVINLSVIDIKNCFKNLKQLDLSFCKLQDGLHYRSFYNFQNLVDLRLTRIHNTNVIHLPTFEKNKNLEYLDLSYMIFSFPPSNENMAVFNHLGKLKTLRTNDWDFSQWNTSSLLTLFAPFSKSITTLQLNNVGFKEIPNIIWEMPNLTVLSMGCNNISRLEAPINTTSNKLKILHLQSNQIEILYPDLIPKSVTDLNLSGNPFDCSCPLMRYVNWARENKMENNQHWQNQYFCAKPRDWKGRSLWEFSHIIKPTDCRPFNAYVITTFVLCFMMIFIVIVINIIMWRKSKNKSDEHEPLLPKA